VEDGTISELVCVEEWTRCDGVGAGGPETVSRPTFAQGADATTSALLDGFVAAYNASSTGLRYEVSAFADGPSSGWRVSPLGVSPVFDTRVSVDAATASTRSAAEEQMFASMFQGGSGTFIPAPGSSAMRPEPPNAVSLSNVTLIEALRAVYRATERVPVGFILNVVPSPPAPDPTAVFLRMPIAGAPDPSGGFPNYSQLGIAGELRELGMLPVEMDQPADRQPIQVLPVEPQPQ
jgi:hypothetical protein